MIDSRQSSHTKAITHNRKKYGRKTHHRLMFGETYAYSFFDPETENQAVRKPSIIESFGIKIKGFGKKLVSKTTIVAIALVAVPVLSLMHDRF